MRLALPLVVLVSAVTLSSCLVPSLQPYYLKSQVVFDPALVGTWRADDWEGSISFSPSAEHGYTVLVGDDSGKTFGYAVYLFAAGPARFLDFQLNKLGCLKDADEAALRTHFVFRVNVASRQLELQPLSEHWTGDWLDAHPKALRHETVDDQIVLTAGTPELQAFLLKHLETEGAFEKAFAYHRAEPPRPRPNDERDGP